MSGRSDDLEAMAVELAARGGRRAASSRVTPRSASLPPRTRPVRLSVDIPPMVYGQLRGWCDTVAAEVGVLKVSHNDVIRLLIDRLLTDPDTSEAIAELAREQAKETAREGRRPGAAP